MKKKYFVIAMIVSMGLSALASQSDDLKFIDELYKQKKFEIAIGESKEFIDKYPDSKYNKKLVDRIAKVYFLQDNYEESIKYFRMLLLNQDLSEKDKEEVNSYLAKAYASIGDEKASQEYLNLITNKSSFYAKTILDVGTIYLEKENYPLATQYFEKLMADKKGEYYNEAILNMALLNYNQKKYPETIDFINAYIKDGGKKNLLFMNYLLGSAYYKFYDVKLAIKTFDDMIAKDRKNQYSQQAILNLIEIYSNMGELDKATQELSLLTNEEYKNDGIRILGDSFAANGNYEKALEYYSQIKDVTNPKLLYSYGYSLYKLKKYKDALVYFQSLKNSSYYNQALYYIFSIEYELKDYKKILDSRDELTKRKVSNEDEESIDIIIANSAYELGEYKISRDYYGRAYAKNPKSENLYRIIIIDNKIGDLDDMQLRFAEYRRKFPNAGDVERKNIYLAMGELLYKRGQVNKAIDVYKEYLKTNSNFEILNNLVTAFLAQQRYDEMSQYLAKMDNSVNNQFLKGVAFLGMGKYQDADKIFEQLEKTENLPPKFEEKLKINEIRSKFLQNKYKEEIEASKQYLEQYPNSKNKGEVLDKMAISYFRIDDFDNSREVYKQLKQLPDYTEYAQFQIADSYYAQKNYQKALENYSELGAKYPNGKYTENANYWFLNALVNLGEFGQFEIDKDAFLEKYPKSPMRDNLLLLSGQIYESTGDRTKLLNNYLTLFETTKSDEIKQEVAVKIIELQIADNNLEQAAKNIGLLQDAEAKTYYNSIILEKSNKLDQAIPEYEKLLAGKKYVDFAEMKLATYYFNKKNYTEARKYYDMINNLENTQYKDLALLQLALIDEIENNTESAYKGFTKGYVLYNGKYSNISKFKAAQMAEKLGKTDEAEKLYKELYSLPSFKERAFVLEKLTYFSLKKENKIEAKKYYQELQKVDKETSKKYDQFFN